MMAEARGEFLVCDYLSEKEEEIDELWPSTTTLYAGTGFHVLSLWGCDPFYMTVLSIRTKGVLRVWWLIFKPKEYSLSFCLLPSKSQFIRLNEIFSNAIPHIGKVIFLSIRLL